MRDRTIAEYAELVEDVRRTDAAPGARLGALGALCRFALELADEALKDGLAVTDEFSVPVTIAARELGVTRRTIYQRRTETGRKDHR